MFNYRFVNSAKLGVCLPLLDGGGIDSGIWGGGMMSGDCSEQMSTCIDDDDDGGASSYSQLFPDVVPFIGFRFKIPLRTVPTNLKK